MIPCNFKQSNQILTRPLNMTDKECTALNVYSDGEECVSCWKMSISERIITFFTGKVWVGVFSGKTQPPIRLSGHSLFLKNSK